jgi:hypothetical protein
VVALVTLSGVANAQALAILAMSAILALGEHLAVATVAAGALGLNLAAVATLGLSSHLAAIAAPMRGASLGAVTAAAALNLGVVAAAMTTVPTLVSERRCCDRQRGSAGREHPNAHGNSPFNERKPTQNTVVPLFIGATGWVLGLVHPILTDPTHRNEH